MRFRLRTLVIVLITSGFLFTSPIRSASAADKGLNGRWKVITTMRGGKPLKDAVGQFATFLDGRYIQEDERGRVTSTGSFTIDSSGKPPTIDTRSDSDEINLGVYELRGDSLEICWGYSKRPKTLDSSQNKTFVHFMFVRVPDE